MTSVCAGLFFFYFGIKTKIIIKRNRRQTQSTAEDCLSAESVRDQYILTVNLQLTISGLPEAVQHSRTVVKEIERKTYFLVNMCQSVQKNTRYMSFYLR